MIEIYTPKEWNSIFSGHPTICIESSGNIYSGNDAYKFGRQAIGYVNWSEGKIYGPDFNSIGAKPIARILDKDGTKLIYKNSDIGFDGRAFPFAKPLFYIQNGKVYDHDPNSTIFDDAQGYVRSDSTGHSSNSSGGSGGSSGSGNSGGGSSGGGGGGGLPGCGLLYVILPFAAIFLIFGVIPENITSITVGIGAIALAIAVVLGLIKGFSFTFKRIVEGILYGGVSFFGFSLFWFIFSGIRANFGSGGGYDENIGLVLLPLAVFVLCLVDFEGENKAKKAEKASQKTYTQNRQTPPNYTQNKQTRSSYTQTKQTQSSYTQPKQNQTTYQTQANRAQSTGSGKYRITCQRCGKEFLSNNASAEICDFCKEFIRKKQNSAASQTSSNYRTCMRCGKQFYAEAANAKYCSICESITAAEKKQAAQQKLVFDIFICPKCGTKNRGPRGKILTCGNPNCRSKFRTEA